MTDDDSVIPSDTVRGAVDMLKAGLCNLSEAAALAGVSRQLMHHWARKINWRKARKAWLSAQWRKRIGRRVDRRAQASR